MSHTVRIRQYEEPLVVEDDETILEAALDKGLDYPFGCQSGACGACKSVVLSGEIELGEYQPFVLTDEERAQNLTLACQTFAKSDLEIAYLDPDEPAEHPVVDLACSVQSVDDATHDIKVVRLALPDGPIAFTPGQFMEVTFDGLPSRDYSIANQPDDDFLEFHIRLVPGGAVSPFVLEQLAAGASVNVRGPLGVSYLRTKHRGPILALAGGSGLAPVKSIVDRALALNMAQPIHLYFGIRDEQDLYLEDYFAGLAVAHDNFTFVPVLSDPSAATERRTGFVHDAIKADFDTLDGNKVYIAGPPVMVDACTHEAIALGVRQDDFHADPFTTEAERKGS
jgi:naphthalene 1,2-dioxygenase ferredoxin reductase component